MGRRYWYLVAVAVAVATPLAIIIARAHGPSSAVQAASCNMSGYKATDGLTATADAGST